MSTQFIGWSRDIRYDSNNNIGDYGYGQTDWGENAGGNIHWQVGDLLVWTSLFYAPTIDPTIRLGVMQGNVFVDDTASWTIIHSAKRGDVWCWVAHRLVRESDFYNESEGIDNFIDMITTVNLADSSSGGPSFLTVWRGPTAVALDYITETSGISHYPPRIDSPATHFYFGKRPWLNEAFYAPWIEPAHVRGNPFGASFLAESAQPWGTETIDDGNTYTPPYYSTDVYSYGMVALDGRAGEIDFTHFDSFHEEDGLLLGIKFDTDPPPIPNCSEVECISYNRLALIQYTMAGEVGDPWGMDTLVGEWLAYDWTGNYDNTSSYADVAVEIGDTFIVVMNTYAPSGATPNIEFGTAEWNPPDGHYYYTGFTQDTSWDDYVFASFRNGDFWTTIWVRPVDDSSIPVAPVQNEGILGTKVQGLPLKDDGSGTKILAQDAIYGYSVVLRNAPKVELAYKTIIDPSQSVFTPPELPTDCVHFIFGRGAWDPSLRIVDSLYGLGLYRNPQGIPDARDNGQTDMWGSYGTVGPPGYQDSIVAGFRANWLAWYVESADAGPSYYTGFEGWKKSDPSSVPIEGVLFGLRIPCDSGGPTICFV